MKELIRIRWYPRGCSQNIYTTHFAQTTVYNVHVVTYVCQTTCIASSILITYSVSSKYYISL